MDSNELRRWREAHGLSQPEFGRLLGVTTTTIWRWEHEQRKPPDWLRFALPQIEAQLKEGKAT